MKAYLAIALLVVSAPALAETTTAPAPPPKVPEPSASSVEDAEKTIPERPFLYDGRRIQISPANPGSQSGAVPGIG